MADFTGHFDIAPYSSTMTVGDTVVPGTITNNLDGKLIGVTMANGTMTGTGTVVLTLVDSLGASVFSGTQAESGTSYVGSSVVMKSEDMNWVVTPSGTQNAANVFRFNVHYEK